MGRHEVYPYGEWMDGEWHEIHPSHYNRSLPSLRSILHQYAKARRKTLLTKKIDDDTLLISFRRAK